MKILALDAATEACSVALYDGGEVRQRFEIAPREHANLLLPMARALLAEAGWELQQLDALAFGRGPGAFTGLRIAAGIVQGLAYGSGLGVAPVSDLAALAAGAARVDGSQRVLAVADARMREVYWCAFEIAGKDLDPRPVTPELVQAPDQIPTQPYADDWAPAGNGWQAYAYELTALAHRLGKAPALVYPRAEDIAGIAARMVRRGALVPPEQALPSYVRDNVARKPVAGTGPTNSKVAR